MSSDTHSSVSFLMPNHSLIFFCRAPFCVSHLGKERPSSAQAASQPGPAGAAITRGQQPSPLKELQGSLLC